MKDLIQLALLLDNAAKALSCLQTCNKLIEGIDSDATKPAHEKSRMTSCTIRFDHLFDARDTHLSVTVEAATQRTHLLRTAAAASTALRNALDQLKNF